MRQGRDRYSLIKIKSSPNWYVQWFEGRHSRRISTGSTSSEAAAAFLAAFALEREAHPEGAQALPDILDWYLATATFTDKARQGYALAHLKRFYGSTLAEDASIATQERYAAHRRAEGVSASTVQRELSVLSAALQLALKHEKIAKAPARHTLPSAPARDRWLTRSEAAALLRQMHRSKRSRHLLLFTRLALFTGARTAAILDLTWDRVDLHRGVIDYAVPDRPETNKRAATIPLEPNLVRALGAARRRSNARYVVSWKGGKVDRVIRGFNWHARQAGLRDVTPHTLRHTFVTWAAMKGESLHLIGRSVGQGNVATTQRYAKHDLKAIRPIFAAVRRK